MGRDESAKGVEQAQILWLSSMEKRAAGAPRTMNFLGSLDEIHSA
jgi:hypothetical protein